MDVWVAAIYLGWMVLMLVSFWVIFTKAGEPGWASVVPIYNIWVLIRIVGRPWWFILLLLIPLVGAFIWFLILWDLAKRYNYGVLMGLGLYFIPFICFPYLAFASK